MYPEQIGKQAAIAGSGYGLQRIDHNPTVEENIDEKIRYCEAEIARLKQSKEELAPLLKMRIRDIHQAMQY
jgi:hypothetical protein